MLVLSRKLGQRVNIGHDIVVTVLEISGNRVRLGFEAPGEVPVHREELARAIAALDHDPFATVPASHVVC